MGAPDSVKRLVDNFQRNIDSYKNGSMNETQLRREYLDPFFTSLGWDVENKSGYADAYKDVIHEYSLKTKDLREAPDYCFRIGGTRKFFVEAKKPSVNIKDDIHPAFQLRSYAWSAKLPLSILTDFEEFSVYDCRTPPNKNDKASNARIKIINYYEYPDKWDEIEEVFHRESILKGSFDKYVESNKKKKGTAEVDAVFLDQMEEWRKLLARNIALRNPNLSIRELNYCVQKTIDRIIFLRICEDRGIEEYGQLLNLQNGTNVYPRLTQIFYRADEKYNSGLFHFEKERDRNEPADTLSLSLNIDDKTIKDIIKELYYPESPYEFSVLPSDILGQVYEQFLGKVIRLTPSHQAVIEDKPEVKKAGGVYYTPTYIVDYIVNNTVGKLLEEKKTPKEASNLRILDPACGSGSFLLGAYQHLLDWHLKYYLSELEKSESILKQKQPPVYKNEKDAYLLTTSEKKRILINNIYGVDIDSQAVEVTKLSLLLKVLEGESSHTITNELNLFRKRALPDLSNNIKCGNSLIGPDFYDQMEMNFLDEEEKIRINVFDWNSEFKEIMNNGGFDVVIGNPPYVRQELLGNLKNYFRNKYKAYHSIADLYSYFIEQAINLLNSNGYFSFIVANKWMRSNYGEPLRKWLKTQNILEIIDFGDLPVFKGTTTYPCIIKATKFNSTNKVKILKVKTTNYESIIDLINNDSYNINAFELNDKGWNLSNSKATNLLDKIMIQGKHLDVYTNKKIFRGLLTGLNEAFVIDESTKNYLMQDINNTNIIKPFLSGKDIKRYKLPPTTNYLIFFPKGFTNKNMGNSKNPWLWLESNYPLLAKYLKSYELACKKRFDQGDYWWELRSCEYFDEFEKQKIMLPDISLKGNFTIDYKGGLYCANTGYIIGSNEKYLLGILNSKLINFCYKNISATYRGGYLRYIYQYLSQLPIIELEKNNNIYLNIEEFVELIFELNNKLQTSILPFDKEIIKRQIDIAENKIDQLVYQLYGLTEEEIKIIETY